MKKAVFLYGIMLVFLISISLSHPTHILSRKRRHLIFPKGSNFIVMLTQTRTLPFAKTPPWYTRLLPIWQGLIEFELKFPLPPELLKDKYHSLHRPPKYPWHDQWHMHGKPGLHGKWWKKNSLNATWHRRWSNKRPHHWHGDRHHHDRHRIHRAVVDLLDANGLNGQACVKRAQCEVALTNVTSKKKKTVNEPLLLDHMLQLIFSLTNSRSSEEDVDCAGVSEECPFSLLEVSDYALY